MSLPFLGAGKRSGAAGARVPRGVRVYAIGDIHGRADLLQDLHRLILADVAEAEPSMRRVVVYLGDYVDRGLQSRDVIDLLIGDPLPGFERVYLKGNHEEAFLDFLDDAGAGPDWFANGGDATVYSYGVAIPQEVPFSARFPHIQEALREAVPPRHIDFLTHLEMTWEIGDYLFVHAGIRPGRALDQQTAQDLLWIRHEFLTSSADHGKVVVHGHSVTVGPDLRDNRIGIDTGAFATGTLTCLVLEGRSRRFLSTASR